MRIVLQRVTRASVSVNGLTTGSIDRGILILLGIHARDTRSQADALVGKCVSLRIFPDGAGKMNRSLADAGGSALVVSQFTLYGDCTKGNRPSFANAAAPAQARELYEYFVAQLRTRCPNVSTGEFGALMNVDLVNDGPVTFVLDA
jgi:D-tyrosyl-tRNA(Tyr) deacylase